MHALAELLIFGFAPLIFGGLVIPQKVATQEASIVGEVAGELPLPAGSELLSPQPLEVKRPG